MTFLWFLVGFMEKWVKSCKSGHPVGVLRHNVETPCRSGGPRHGVAFHATAWPSGEFDHSRVRRDVATVHNMENYSVLVLFYYSVAPRTRLLD